MVLYIFRFKINTLLCYTVVSVLVLVSLEANIIGYWILGIWYRSNPNGRGKGPHQVFRSETGLTEACVGSAIFNSYWSQTAM